MLLFPHDLLNNANNFNLLALPWFFTLDTHGDHIGNLKIQISWTRAIPTKFESQSKIGNSILKISTSYSDEPPWFKTTSLYT